MIDGHLRRVGHAVVGVGRPAALLRMSYQIGEHDRRDRRETFVAQPPQVLQHVDAGIRAVPQGSRETAPEAARAVREGRGAHVGRHQNRGGVVAQDGVGASLVRAQEDRKIEQEVPLAAPGRDDLGEGRVDHLGGRQAMLRGCRFQSLNDGAVEAARDAAEAWRGQIPERCRVGKLRARRQGRQEILPECAIALPRGFAPAADLRNAVLAIADGGRSPGLVLQCRLVFLRQQSR